MTKAYRIGLLTTEKWRHAATWNYVLRKGLDL